MVCPPILVGHWAHEVGRFVGASLRALACEGPPTARAALHRTLDGSLDSPQDRAGGAAERPIDLVVMSYEVRARRGCRPPKGELRILLGVACGAPAVRWLDAVRLGGARVKAQYPCVAGAARGRGVGGQPALALLCAG